MALLICCVTACSEPQTPDNNPDNTPDDSNPTPTPPVTPTIYEKLDSFADKDYQKIKLDITTVTGDVELSSSYTLTDSNVTYRIEQLNTLPTDGSLTGVSSSYKTDEIGTAKIVDGKVTRFDGKAVTLPSYDELKGSFSFEESNFKNAVNQTFSFSADVISPSSFYGSDVSVQNMKVKVEYTGSAFSRIIITYNTELSTVTVTYGFTA